VTLHASSRSPGERHLPVFMLRGFCEELEKRNVAPIELERRSRVKRPAAGDTK
jgi:hypothetical protein